VGALRAALLAAPEPEDRPSTRHPGPRRVVRHALQQVRVTPGVGRVQAEQIDASGDANRHGGGGRGDGSGADGVHASRRITRVPLVPPKPNELDIATSICIARAVLGT